MIVFHKGAFFLFVLSKTSILLPVRVLGASSPISSGWGIGPEIESHLVGLSRALACGKSDYEARWQMSVGEAL